MERKTMFEAATSSPDRRPAPHVAKLAPLTLVVAEVQFDGWFQSAHKGGLVIYAVGVALPQKNATCLKVGKLAREGRLALTQRPLEQPGCARKFEYCARRLADPAPGAQKRKPGRSTVSLEGSIEGKILAEIARAANFGRPCPSYAELARALDLPNREIARYRFQRLADLGFLEILPERQNQRRVVRITATGKFTKRRSV
jgi:hypothetical protein